MKALYDFLLENKCFVSYHATSYSIKMALAMLETRHIWIVDGSNCYRAMNQNERIFFTKYLIGLIDIFNKHNDEDIGKFLNRDQEFGLLGQCKILPIIAEIDKNTQLKRIVADCLDDYLVEHGRLPDRTNPIVEAVKNHSDVYFVGHTIYIDGNEVKIEVVKNCIRNLIKIYT